MKALSVVLGVIMLICGFMCVVTPFATFLFAGYLIGILLLVFGIIGLIMAVSNKSGALQIILCVLAAVVGFIAIVRPGGTLIIDGILIILVAIWLLLQGIILIVMSVKNRKSNGLWFLGIIVGVLALLLGAYSLGHPMFAAIATGLLIGFYFMQIGLSMIIMAGADTK